jgi:aspartyl-tRNA(Asn)/glutamyl-tRNA(Gln) amidotransferase subunit A
MDILNKSITEITHAIQKGEISVKEIAEQTINRIKEKEPQIKAFVHIDFDKIMQDAEALDKKSEKSGALFGVPVAIKDNMNMKNTETTAGSKILKGYISPYDATVVSKLKSAGALIVGKTNMDEFAMGSSTENSAFFKTHNPVNPEYVPGGSSGGSAAAVKANEVVASLGSDTGGSIREPAAFCGVVGLKPTYGRVSRYGLIAFASSLDQIGPFGRTVKDTGTMLNVIAGFDDRDETSVEITESNFNELIGKSIKGKKIGIIKEVKDFALQEEVKENFETLISKAKELGATVQEISIPHLKYALPVYYIIAPAEASANLSRFDGVRYGMIVEGKNLRETYEKTRTEGFGTEVKRRILIGTFTLSAGYYDAYYLKASKVRRLIEQDFEKAFESVDTLFLPTTARTAFKIGEITNPLEMYMNDIFTIPVNLAGLPAISLPTGKDKKGLPIGMQFVGKWFAEKELLQIAYAFEQALGGNNGI